MLVIWEKNSSSDIIMMISWELKDSFTIGDHRECPTNTYSFPKKTSFLLKFIFITSGLNSPKDITISQCTRLGVFECVKSLSRKLIHRPARGRSLDLHSAQTYPSAVQSHLDLDSWNDVDVPIIALSSHLTRAHTHSSKQKKTCPKSSWPQTEHCTGFNFSPNLFTKRSPRALFRHCSRSCLSFERFCRTNCRPAGSPSFW